MDGLDDVAIDGRVMARMGVRLMGFIADAMRIIENKQAEKKNRQRGEEHLLRLQIEKLEREARDAEREKR